MASRWCCSAPLPEVAGVPLEDLAEVPGQEGPLGAPLRPLGSPDWLAAVAEQQVIKAGGAVGLIGDEQHGLGVDGEASQVEELVVQHAQSQAVALPVRATGLVPANVGRTWTSLYLP